MSGPTIFKVTEAVGPVGQVPVVKQAIDIREIFVDFTAWLGVGETLAAISNFAIQANPSQSYPSWQSDFPFVTPSSPAPADTNPLYADGATILNGATQARVLIAGGTPGLAYMFSFLAFAAPAQRAKEIDVLVSINQTVNTAMISSTTPPTQSVTVVSATYALLAGTTGSVNIENGTSAPITVTLPPTPVLDQTLNMKDVNLNAGTYPITLAGANGALIDGSATYVFAENGAAAQLVWTGSQWSVR